MERENSWKTKKRIELIQKWMNENADKPIPRNKKIEGLWLGDWLQKTNKRMLLGKEEFIKGDRDKDFALYVYEIMTSWGYPKTIRKRNKS